MEGVLRVLCENGQLNYFDMKAVRQSSRSFKTITETYGKPTIDKSPNYRLFTLLCEYIVHILDCDVKLVIRANISKHSIFQNILYPTKVLKDFFAFGKVRNTVFIHGKSINEYLGCSKAELSQYIEIAEKYFSDALMAIDHTMNIDVYWLNGKMEKINDFIEKLVKIVNLMSLGYNISIMYGEFPESMLIKNIYRPINK
jgi:hypothetical protein